jgi:hypothetical protein
MRFLITDYADYAGELSLRYSIALITGNADHGFKRITQIARMNCDNYHAKYAFYHNDFDHELNGLHG